MVKTIEIHKNDVSIVTSISNLYTFYEITM